MPLTPTQTRAQLADQARNPRRQVAGGSALGGQTIQVSLTFQNRNFIPEDLFDALEAKYGVNKVFPIATLWAIGSFTFALFRSQAGRGAS